MERSTIGLGLEAPGLGGQAARIARLARRHRAIIAWLGILTAAVLVAWRPLHDGGLFFDDWWVRSLALYDHGADRNGFFGYWDGIYSISQYRPLDVPYFMVHVAFTDFDPFRYQLWGCLVAALAGGMLYTTLRIARLPWPFAVAAALIFITIPFASSAKFWSSESLANASIVLFLSGLALGGVFMRDLPERRRWGLFAASLALIAATAAFYEIALPLLAIAPLFYAAAHGRWTRLALYKTAADVGAACLVLAIFRSAGRTDTAPVAEWWPHARSIVSDAATLFTGGLTPGGRSGTLLIAICAVLAVAVGVRLLTHRESAIAALRASGRRFAALAGLVGLGLVAALLGYLLLVPDPWYGPLMPGQGDRSNCIAVIGYSIAYVAIAGLLATLAVAAVPARWAKAAQLSVFGALLAVLAGSFATQTRAQGDLYIAQWQRADELYRAVDETLAVPPPAGTMVLSFGSTAYVAPLIHSLGEWSDFDAAVKLATGTGEVRAAPIFTPQEVVCGAAGIELPAQYGGGPVLGPDWSTAYGSVIFMQPYERRTEPIGSRAECRSALTRFAPGPLY